MTLYEAIPIFEKSKILSSLFDLATTRSEKNKMVYSAAYHHDREFFVELAHAVLSCDDDELKFTAVDAVHSFMSAQATTYGLKELIPRIVDFRNGPGRHFLDIDLLVGDIVEFEAREL